MVKRVFLGKKKSPNCHIMREKKIARAKGIFQKNSIVLSDIRPDNLFN
jgi:hypothetical protein